MLVWLLHRLVDAQNTGTLLTLRTALASLTAFLVALLAGPWAITWLKERFRERIASDSATLDALHAGKKNTPTMGGLFILGAIFVAILGWGDLANPYLQMGLMTALGLGTLGAIDDWIKLSTRKKGLSIRQKLAGQCLLGLIVGVWLYTVQSQKGSATELWLVWANRGIPLGTAFIAWSLFVLVGSSNGVNLTDGLDGLAAGCLIFAGLAFAVLCYLSGNTILADYLAIPYVSESGEMAVFLGAMVGAVLGFLWFNSYPAQVFMGDAGALPLGGILGFAALVCRQELLLIIVGGVFVVETVSVMGQVISFRCFGKRIIACAPLHNHFVFRGVHEVKIVTRFWIVAALLALSGIASLRLFSAG